jgi:hypothetical protein
MAGAGDLKSPGSIPVWVQVPPRLPTDYEVTMLVCHRCGGDKVTHAVALGSKSIHLGKFADFEYIKKHDGLVPECAQCQKDREYISRYMKYSENIIKDDIKEHKHYIKLLEEAQEKSAKQSQGC